jgi:hypothetical protein
MANLLADLAKALADGGIEMPDEGFLTAEQHAVASGLSVQQAGKILLAGIRAGKAERRNFRIRNGARVVPIPHYRVTL